MADLPRLNNIIRALEAGQHALTCFAPAHVDSAIGMSASKCTWSSVTAAEHAEPNHQGEAARRAHISGRQVGRSLSGHMRTLGDSAQMRQ